MTHATGRAARLVLATGVAALVLMGLPGCTGTGDDARPSPSSSTPRATSTADATAAPESEATSVPTPDAGGEFVTGAPVPGATAPAVVEPDPGDYPATPLVTFATWNAASGQLEAGGVVTGQLDPQGSCQLVLVRGSSRVERESVPQASASSVDCGQFVVPRAELAPGTWSVTLRYVVRSSSATSEPVQVEVSS